MQPYLSREAQRLAMATEIGASVGGDMAFVAVDINICFCTILANLLREAVADMGDFKLVVSFIEKYKQWRELMAEYCDASPNATKKS
eukprot:1326524-Pyramimonas_sp.AAC.1